MSATWKAKPQDMERLVGAVLPHTSPDGYFPMLTCVHVEVSAGQVTIVGTDRYTMAITWAKLSDWDEEAATDQEIQASIFAADFRRLFAFLKPNRKAAAEWTLTDAGLTVAVGGESLTVRIADIDFVKWRSLWGQIATRDTSGVSAMCFTPSKIDQFTQSAKALGEALGQAVWRFGSKTTDAAVIQIGTNFVGLLMPQRMEEPPALDLSALGIETTLAVSA